MSVPARTPLGASTLNRKWMLDVNTGTLTAPVWTPVRGITSFVPNMTPTMMDDSDFDSQGYKSQTATALAWDCTFDVSRKTNPAAPTTYDAGQEALRTTSLTMGISNSIQIRFYEVTNGGPAVEAWQGMVAVQWSEKGGNEDALDQVAVKLIGQGQRVAIAHPASASNVPVILTLSPSGTGIAGGGEIEVNGEYLTGATAVSVAGTALAASAWAVVNDGLIVFVAPAKTAGSYPVTVTTPAGVSTGVNLTYS